MTDEPERPKLTIIDDTPEFDLVWSSTVDGGTWEAKVERHDESNDYIGTLTVTRLSDGYEILREEVGLAYGAPFGPDVDDVNQWQEKTITAIDSFEGEKT